MKKNETREMLVFAGKKLMQMIILLFLLSFLVFVIARLCPGDPLRAYYGDGLQHMSQEQQENARERLGLNDPVIVQYGRWLSGLFHGDLGISYQYKQPVTSVISAMWPNTLLLGGTAYVLTFGLALLLGMYCALREGSLADRIICKIGVISGNIPAFFVALLLILFFAVYLGILPVGGAYSYGNSGNLWDRILHLLLPVTVLVLEHLWYYAYLIRNKLAEETRQDYVLLCKGKGLSRGKIVRKDCLKNILPSLLTVMALGLPHILGGTYVVETVFSYPGIGSLSFESAMYQDYNMLMALTMLTGLVVVLCNGAAQMISERLDPRMAYVKVEER